MAKINESINETQIGGSGQTSQVGGVAITESNSIEKPQGRPTKLVDNDNQPTLSMTDNNVKGNVEDDEVEAVDESSVKATGVDKTVEKKKPTKPIKTTESDVLTVDGANENIESLKIENSTVVNLEKDFDPNVVQDSEFDDVVTGDEINAEDIIQDSEFDDVVIDDPKKEVEPPKTVSTYDEAKKLEDEGWIIEGGGDVDAHNSKYRPQGFALSFKMVKPQESVGAVNEDVKADVATSVLHKGIDYKLDNGVWVDGKGNNVDNRALWTILNTESNNKTPFVYPEVKGEVDAKTVKPDVKKIVKTEKSKDIPKTVKIGAETYFTYKDKPDNLYVIDGGSWFRLTPDSKDWVLISNEGSINALNSYHKKKVKVPADKTTQLNAISEVVEARGQGIDDNGLDYSNVVTSENIPKNKSIFTPSKTTDGTHDFNGSNLYKPNAKPTKSGLLTEAIVKMEHDLAKGINEGTIDVEKQSEIQDKIVEIKNIREEYLREEEVTSFVSDYEIPKVNSDVILARKRIESGSYGWTTEGELLRKEDEIKVEEFDVKRERQIVNDKLQNFIDKDEDVIADEFGLNAEQVKSLKSKTSKLSLMKNMPFVNIEELEKEVTNIENEVAVFQEINNTVYKASLNNESLTDYIQSDKVDMIKDFEQSEETEGLFFSINAMREELKYYVDNGMVEIDEDSGVYSYTDLISDGDKIIVETKLASLRGVYDVKKAEFLNINADALDALNKQKKVLSNSIKKYEKMLNTPETSLRVDIEKLNEAKNSLYEINKSISDLEESHRGILNNDVNDMMKQISMYKTETSVNSYKAIEGNNLSDKQKFDVWYKTLYDTTIKLMNDEGFDLGDRFFDFLDGVFATLEPREKEIYKNLKTLERLKDLYFNNDWGVTEESAGFWSSFGRGMSRVLVNETGVGIYSETEQVREQNEVIVGKGLSHSTSNLSKSYANRSEISWLSLEKSGEVLGMVGGIVVAMGVSSIAVNSVLGMSATIMASLKRIKSLADKIKIIENYVKFQKTSLELTKYGKLIMSATESGINYEATGRIFKNTTDYMTFSDGFLGFMASASMKKVFKELAPSDILNYVYSIFGKEQGGKVVMLLKSVGKGTQGLKNRAYMGAGETAEEFTQELLSIYRETLTSRGFFDELENRFGDLDSSMEFLITTFVLGSVIGHKNLAGVSADFEGTISKDDRIRYKAIQKELGIDFDLSRQIAEEESLEMVNRIVESYKAESEQSKRTKSESTKEEKEVEEIDYDEVVVSNVDDALDLHEKGYRPVYDGIIYNSESKETLKSTWIKGRDVTMVAPRKMIADAKKSETDLKVKQEEASNKPTITERAEKIKIPEEPGTLSSTPVHKMFNIAMKGITLTADNFVDLYVKVKDSKEWEKLSDKNKQKAEEMLERIEKDLNKGNLKYKAELENNRNDISRIKNLARMFNRGKDKGVSKGKKIGTDVEKAKEQVRKETKKLLISELEEKMVESEFRNNPAIAKVYKLINGVKTASDLDYVLDQIEKLDDRLKAEFKEIFNKGAIDGRKRMKNEANYNADVIENYKKDLRDQFVKGVKESISDPTLAKSTAILNAIINVKGDGSRADAEKSIKKVLDNLKEQDKRLRREKLSELLSDDFVKSSKVTGVKYSKLPLASREMLETLRAEIEARGGIDFLNEAEVDEYLEAITNVISIGKAVKKTIKHNTEKSRRVDRYNVIKAMLGGSKVDVKTVTNKDVRNASWGGYGIIYDGQIFTSKTVLEKYINNEHKLDDEKPTFRDVETFEAIHTYTNEEAEKLYKEASNAIKKIGRGVTKIFSASSKTFENGVLDLIKGTDKETKKYFYEKLIDLANISYVKEQQAKAKKLKVFNEIYSNVHFLDAKSGITIRDNKLDLTKDEVVDIFMMLDREHGVGFDVNGERFFNESDAGKYAKENKIDKEDIVVFDLGYNADVAVKIADGLDFESVEAKVKEIRDYINSNEKLLELSNDLFEFYEDMKDDYKDFYEEEFSLPMPEGKYVPFRKETVKESTSVTSSNIKTRASIMSKNLLEKYEGITNADFQFNVGSKQKVLDYIHDMEHTINFKELEVNGSLIFNDKYIANAIKSKIGTDKFTSLKNHFDRMLVGTSNSTADKVLNGMIKVMIIQQLNLRPSNITKQATSFTHFMVYGLDKGVSVKSFLQAMGSSVDENVKALDFLKDQPYFKERLLNSDLDVALRESGRKKSNTLSKAERYMSSAVLSPILLGDIIGVSLGAVPYYIAMANKLKKDGLSDSEAHQKAYEETVLASEHTQQSSRDDIVSNFQSSPAGRFFNTYRTSQTAVIAEIQKNIKIINGGDAYSSVEKRIAGIKAIYGVVAQIPFVLINNSTLQMYYDDDNDSVDILNYKDLERPRLRKEQAIRDLFLDNISSLLQGMGLGGSALDSTLNILRGRDIFNKNPTMDFLYSKMAKGLSAFLTLSIVDFHYEALSEEDKKSLGDIFFYGNLEDMINKQESNDFSIENLMFDLYPDEETEFRHVLEKERGKESFFAEYFKYYEGGDDFEVIDDAEIELGDGYDNLGNSIQQTKNRSEKIKNEELDIRKGKGALEQMRREAEEMEKK